jgi:hypothetical protein
VESCVEAGLAEEDLPTGLVVFSDMQFDAAGGDITWKGLHGQDCMDRIEALWQEHGYACAPKIIFWNLAANTESFPAQAGTKNVQMVSGFSQNLVKAFVTDTELEVVTPEETLRALLSEEWLDELRSAFDPDSTSLEDAVAVAGRGRLVEIETLLANLYPGAGEGACCEDSDGEGKDDHGKGHGCWGHKRSGRSYGGRGTGKGKGKWKGAGESRRRCRN